MNDPLLFTRGSPVVRPALAAYFHLDRLVADHAPMLEAAVQALFAWLGPAFAVTEASVFPVEEPSTFAHLDLVAGRALSTRARLHPIPELQGIFNIDAKLLRDDFFVHMRSDPDSFAASATQFEFWSTIGTVSETDPQLPVYSSFFLHVPVTTPLGEFTEQVNKLAQLLPLRWGSAGYSYTWARPSWRAATDYIRTHSRRHYGFDPGFHHRSLEYLYDHLRSVNWLTYVGASLLAEHPEIAAALTTPPPGLAVATLGSTLGIRAGDQPQEGDVNRLVVPREYVAVDRIVRAARADDGDRVTFIGEWTNSEVTAWLRRFERASTRAMLGIVRE